MKTVAAPISCTNQLNIKPECDKTDDCHLENSKAFRVQAMLSCVH